MDRKENILDMRKKMNDVTERRGEEKRREEERRGEERRGEEKRGKEKKRGEEARQVPFQDLDD